MAYNKNLYTSSTSALDAGIIYDQTETKMQSEINADLKSTTSSLKNSLIPIHITGTTNTWSSNIPQEIYFYLNGTLVKSLVEIPKNAALTLNTNYVEEPYGISAVSSWHVIGSVIGSTALTIPSNAWEELYLTFWLYANPNIAFDMTIARHTNHDLGIYHSIVGYLSQFAITQNSLSATPHLLWVDVYINGTTIQIKDANAEDGVGNYRLEAYYKD